MTRKLLSVDDVRALLAESVRAAGSQSAWARKFAYSRSIVSNVLLSKREPTPEILSALKLKRVILYEGADEPDR